MKLLSVMSHLAILYWQRHFWRILFSNSSNQIKTRTLHTKKSRQDICRRTGQSLIWLLDIENLQELSTQVNCCQGIYLGLPVDLCDCNYVPCQHIFSIFANPINLCTCKFCCCLLYVDTIYYERYFVVYIFLIPQFVTFTTLLAKDWELTDDKLFILCTSQDLFSASQGISFWSSSFQTNKCHGIRWIEKKSKTMALAAATMISRSHMKHSAYTIIAQCNCINPHKIMIRDHTDYSRYFPSCIILSVLR